MNDLHDETELAAGPERQHRSGPPDLLLVESAVATTFQKGVDGKATREGQVSWERGLEVRVQG